LKTRQNKILKHLLFVPPKAIITIVTINRERVRQMGTRCNIVLKCGDHVRYIYRHYDGYPSSVEPELKKYADAIRWYVDHRCAKHARQSHYTIEYFAKMLDFYADLLVKHSAWDQAMPRVAEIENVQTPYEPMQLEGKYEITTGIHGDIDWRYNITIDNKTHKVCEISYSRVTKMREAS
jgi:hypothetical protein